MEQEKEHWCAGCETLVDQLFYDCRIELCIDCNNDYDDKTGYCSLDCCITGNCDGSC